MPDKLVLFKNGIFLSSNEEHCYGNIEVFENKIYFQPYAFCPICSGRLSIHSKELKEISEILLVEQEKFDNKISKVVN